MADCQLKAVEWTSSFPRQKLLASGPKFSAVPEVDVAGVYHAEGSRDEALCRNGS